MPAFLTSKSSAGRTSTPTSPWTLITSRNRSRLSLHCSLSPSLSPFRFISLKKEHDFVRETTEYQTRVRVSPVSKSFSLPPSLQLGFKSSAGLRSGLLSFSQSASLKRKERIRAQARTTAAHLAATTTLVIKIKRGPTRSQALPHSVIRLREIHP